MRTRTRAELRTEVEERCDLPASSATTHVTLAMMNNWLRQSSRSFADLLISSYGEKYFYKNLDFSTVNGQQEYPLPADFYQHHLFRVDVSGRDETIHRASTDTLYIDPQGRRGWVSAALPRYRLLGANIVFTPIPRGVHLIRHWYIPTLVVLDASDVPKADFDDDTDKIDGHNGWEDWLILDMCAKVQVRQRRDAMEYLRERGIVEQRITIAAGNRDSGERPEVRRTYELSHYWRNVYSGGSR